MDAAPFSKQDDGKMSPAWMFVSRLDVFGYGVIFCGNKIFLRGPRSANLNKRK